MNDDRFADMLSHPMLRGLSQQGIECIRRALTCKTLSVGEYIFGRGKRSAGWYLVIAGEINLLTSSASGDEVVLEIVREGDWFGEVGILAQCAEDFDAQARRDCVLALLPAGLFRQLLAREPELLTRVAARLARRVETLAALAVDVSVQPMPVRLAKRVVALNGECAEPEFRASQEEYGRLISARRQSINRELRKWEQAGWISIRYGRIKVLNREALERLAAGNTDRLNGCRFVTA